MLAAGFCVCWQKVFPVIKWHVMAGSQLAILSQFSLQALPHNLDIATFAVLLSICFTCALHLTLGTNHAYVLFTFATANVSVPEEIIFELISETAFLHGGWEELINSEMSFRNPASR